MVQDRHGEAGEAGDLFGVSRTGLVEVMGHEHIDENVAVQIGGGCRQREQETHRSPAQSGCSHAAAVCAKKGVDVAEEPRECAIGSLDSTQQFWHLCDWIVESAASQPKE